MIAEQLNLLKQQKNYYRNNFRRIVRFLLISLFVIVGLIGVLVFKFFTMSSPYYYATSSDGQLTQLMPVPPGTGLIDREHTQ